jgi:endonuclease III
MVGARCACPILGARHRAPTIETIVPVTFYESISFNPRVKKEFSMNIEEFVRVWPSLKKQVRSLKLPWIDRMAARKRDPFQVLISCILSLRTQDKTTEAASRRLFQMARTPETLSKIPVAEIQKAIYPVGFYRVKARQIREIGEKIVRKHGGKVPDTIEELLTLKGVGRKTANLVVTVGYDRDGICVDTHVHRITNRWGLIQTKNPTQTEFALREILPKRYWKQLNGHLVAFGQGICKPVSPLCSGCKIFEACERVGVTKSR